MILLGITGKKKSGKDAVVEMLRANITGRLVMRVGFADALKQEVAEACGVRTDYIEANKDNFRLMLQGWGTDFRRKLFGDDYWIKKYKATFYDLKKLYSNTLIVTPDVRFHNEYAAIQQLGGTIIRVRRTQFPATNSDEHPSETEQDSFVVKRTLYNEGTLADLEAEVKGLISEMKLNL